MPLDWDRAIDLPMKGRSVLRVVDLEGLIRLKLKAQAPQDLMDVAALLFQHPEHLERAREVAAPYGVADNLDLWLADRRLRARVKRRKGKRGPA